MYDYLLVTSSITNRMIILIHFISFEDCSITNYDKKVSHLFVMKQICKRRQPNYVLNHSKLLIRWALKYPIHEMPITWEELELD